MRRYLQITIVFCGFFLLVLFKNLLGSENENKVVSSPAIPSFTPLSSPNQTPSAPSSSLQTIIYKKGTFTS